MNKRIDRPGYDVWVKGGTRGEMQDANLQAGFLCYCASLWDGYCDFCTGLASLDGVRAQEQLKYQAAVHEYRQVYPE